MPTTTRRVHFNDRLCHRSKWHTVSCGQYRQTTETPPWSWPQGLLRLIGLPSAMSAPASSADLENILPLSAPRWSSLPGHCTQTCLSAFYSRFSSSRNLQIYLGNLTYIALTHPWSEVTQSISEALWHLNWPLNPSLSPQWKNIYWGEEGEGVLRKHMPTNICFSKSFVFCWKSKVRNLAFLSWAFCCSKRQWLPCFTC